MIVLLIWYIVGLAGIYALDTTNDDGHRSEWPWYVFGGLFGLVTWVGYAFFIFHRSRV